MAFCPNCGTSLEEGAKFCTSCGASMASAGQPAIPGQPAASAQPQQLSQPATSSAGKNYETLGGWLLFFVIGTLMVSSLGLAVVGGTVVTEFGIVAGAGIGLVLMTMYFCKSERVRVYMGSTEYLDTALFKIGV